VNSVMPKLGLCACSPSCSLAIWSIRLGWVRVDEACNEDGEQRRGDDHGRHGGEQAVEERQPQVRLQGVDGDPAARAARPAGLRTDLSASGLPGSRASFVIPRPPGCRRARGRARSARLTMPLPPEASQPQPSRPRRLRASSLRCSGGQPAAMSNYNALHQTRGSSLRVDMQTLFADLGITTDAIAA
jgi:hypothetical protein